MAITSDRAFDHTRIRIQGRFDFSVRFEFQKILGEQPRSGRVIVDFLNVPDIDSSALGMLLILRDRVGGSSADVSLINCNATLRRIFKVARFHELFKIK